MLVRSLEEDLLTLFSSTGTVKVIGCTLLQAVEFKRVDAAVPLLSGDLSVTQHCCGARSSDPRTNAGAHRAHSRHCGTAGEIG